MKHLFFLYPFVLVCLIGASCTKAKIDSSEELEINNLFDYLKFGESHANRTGNVSIFDNKGFGDKSGYSGFENAQIFGTFFDKSHMIDFLPRNPVNQAFSGKSPYRKVIQTKDDGSHELRSFDFGTIPKGAQIRLFVGRGFYDQTNNNVILYGITTAEDKFFIN